MTVERNFVIEEVRDLDAAWEEITALFLELYEYSWTWSATRTSCTWYRT